jgi:tripartite-type tricarboxylate transporter receptor subunit TctC
VALGCSLAASPTISQVAYPDRAIRFIVPNPPGGLPDTITRILTRRLQERIGQPAIVENRPGANAGLGTAALLSSPPDGYTFMVTDGSIISINPLLYRRLPYDPKAVVPVALLARAPIFLAIHPKVPVTNMKEFIEYAKSHPGKLNYGSIGVGSFHHLSMEALKAALSLQIEHVPFKGSGESMNAFLGGHVDLVFSSYAALRGAAEQKKLVLLATNGAQRSSQAPDVPSLAEFIPGFDLAVLQGIFAPAGTPEAIIQKIAAEAAAIVKEADVVAQFSASGIEPVGAGPEEHRAALEKETDRVAKIVREAGIKPQS